MTLDDLRATKGCYKNGKELYEEIRRNPDLKHTIEESYLRIFKRRLNKNCSNCWFDAWVELMYNQIDKIMDLEKCKFSLRAGALLVDIATGDNSKMATNANLTDELAMYHIRRNPSWLKYFDRIPDNLDDLLAEVAPEEQVLQDKLDACREKLEKALEKGHKPTIARLQKSVGELEYQIAELQ